MSFGGSDSDDAADCPLCCAELDLTDRSIQYCGCGYQMCLWCYHHLVEEAGKEALPARCPNCRSEYNQTKIQMQHIDAEQLEQEKRKLREKDKPRTAAMRSRASLTNVRVVQPNLVYAVGLSLELCQESLLRSQEFFGQWGRIVKVSVNRSNQYASALAKHGPTGSAYVTFRRAEDALRCIKALDGAEWRGKPVKACFGTTKYCSAFLRSAVCTNPDCLYLHDPADEADCLTKEEVAAGLLPARFMAMGAANTFKPRLTINPIPNAATAAAQAAAAAAAPAGAPQAAIAAAAAAAGGISRPGGGPGTAAPAPAAPRTIAVPLHRLSPALPPPPEAPAANGAAGGSHWPAPQATPAPAPPASGPPGATWATVSAATAPPPTPPPAAAPAVTALAANSQEWPELGGGAASPAPSGNLDDGGGSGTPEPLARSGSTMAEQIARAHSMPQEARPAARPARKLLPLASPAKLKTLGKPGAPAPRPTSPPVAAANGTVAAVAAEAQGDGAVAGRPAAGRPAAAPPPGIPSGSGATDLPGAPPGACGTDGGPAPAASDPVVPRPPASRRPPPGFAPADAAAPAASAHRPKKVGPPPGFGGPRSGAATPLNTSLESSTSLEGLPSAFAGAARHAAAQPQGLRHSGPPAAQEATSPSRGASAGGAAAALTRRQRSRFAFAQESDEAASAAAAAATAAAEPGRQLEPSPAFRAAFPGVTINVAPGPPRAQPTEQLFGSLGMPLSGPAAADPPYNPQYNPIASMFPVPQELGCLPAAPAAAGLSPGLALLQALQGGGRHGAPPPPTHLAAAPPLGPGLAPGGFVDPAIMAAHPAGVPPGFGGGLSGTLPQVPPGLGLGL